MEEKHMLLNSNSSYLYPSCTLLSWLKFVPGIIIDSNPGVALLTYTTIGKWNKTTTTTCLTLQRRLQVVWMYQRLKS